jgi:hypothetical protein
MNEYCYFILPDVISSDKNTLSSGERIFAIPTNWPVNIHFKTAEGPFFNLKYLMEYSKMYQNLKQKNPKRAHKIVQKEYIIKVKKGIITEAGLTYERDFLDSLEHLIQGEIKNEKVTGIHFYNEKRVKIIEILETNQLGVWSAIIEKFDPKTNNWIKKESSTTFFPRSWSLAKTISEITDAEKNKVRKVDSQNIYTSKTTSGIVVEIIIMNGKMKTIYPIL